MTNFSSISMNAVISVLILVGGLFVYQATVRQPRVNLIYGPSGEARQLPIDLLRLRPAMW